MSTEKKLPNEKDQLFVIKNQPAESGDFPQCAVASCHNHEGQIHELCHTHNWPPGHKVLVCSADGYCCTCNC